MQKNYYLSLLEKETETKKYRHDMNNHIICIKAFLDEKEYDNLNNYIDNLYNQTFSLVNKGYHTGNSIIDALTNYYVENMDKSIEIELKGKIVRGLDENHGNLDIRAENHEFCIKATLPLVSGEV